MADKMFRMRGGATIAFGVAVTDCDLCDGWGCRECEPYDDEEAPVTP